MSSLSESVGVLWLLAAASGAGWVGKAAFIGVFVALIVLLASLPARMLGETECRPALWRNVRAWAILVAAAQILIYTLWG
ncbi:MAG TPA: hypothetical protein PK640_05555 [Verrucomicrobiota bacterium]|nr:hypothetical protein [Verrucomicrobiota bacterium]